MYLNIFEISSGTLTHSLPTATKTRWFKESVELWAPTGGLFLMLDRTENWQILDAQSGNQTAITKSDGTLMHDPDWNHSGSQVAFFTPASYRDLLRLVCSTIVVQIR